MAVTGFRRFTTVGASSITSGDTSDLITTGTGAVNFSTEGQFVELSSPKSADSQGAISPLSADIPLGAKLTGIEWFYAVRIFATTMPSTTIRARLKLGDSNVSDNHDTTTSTTITTNLTGGGDGSFHGLSGIDIYNPQALNTVKFEYSLHDVTGFASGDFSVSLLGINFGDTLLSLKPPTPAVRVYYKTARVVVTNPTRVVLNNNKRVHIGYTSGSSFNSG